MKKSMLMMIGAMLVSTGFAVNRGAVFSLDNVFTDHMVLQRDKPLRFTGCSQYGTEVEVDFDGERVRTTADIDGRWVIELPARKAGGPYKVTVRCASLWCPDSAITLEDVLVGDVWYCSGQSNMEFYMWCDSEFFRFPKGDEIAATFKDNGLRLLYIPHVLSPDGPMTEIAGRHAWEVADHPEAIKTMSAVGFWFGARLRKALEEKVPVGIISCSWGGTPIQPWIPGSEWAAVSDTEILKVIADNSVPNAKCDAESRRKSEAEARARTVARLNEWIAKFEASSPIVTAAAKKGWGAKKIDEREWKRTSKSTLLDEPGIAWYRYDVEIPAECDGHAATCEIGFVNDCDETWFDGEKIGETGVDIPDYWSARRSYPIKKLEKGMSVVAIRAKSHYLTGMISKDLAIVDKVTGKRIEFGKGEFLERLELRPDLVTNGQRPAVPWGMTFDDPRLNADLPATLYNAMTAPLTAMNIRGAIWYQGCSNVGAHEKYARWQRLLIEGLRREWRDDKLPFIITQLSAFQEHRPKYRLPDDFWKKFETPDAVEVWSDFRLMQDRVAQEIPYAGVACTIDVGNHSDIHPTNKLAVAERLLNEAMRISYGDRTAIASPRAAAAKLAGDAIVVSFRDVGKGLTLGQGVTKFHPHLFQLAGADGVFAWADGELMADGTVKVTSAKVAKPVKVRYAFSSYPPGVTFRRVGDDFPVFPFELTAK